jgi:hypothetical protein
MNVSRDFATLQDFIGGRLSEDEHRAFEDRLVCDPTLVRELEQSLRMREGLQQLRTQGYFHKAAARGRRFRLWVPALAAAAGAGLAVFLWLSRVTGPSPILTPALESRAAGNAAASVAAHFTFVAVRGAAPDLQLPSAGVIEIRAAPGMRETFHRYRLTLVRQQEGGVTETVAALSGLSVNADGYVHCYADASRLTPGSYILRLQPDNDTHGTVDVFPFNLRAGITGSSG